MRLQITKYQRLATTTTKNILENQFISKNLSNLLTHSAREYFEKLTFKKSKTRLYLKSQVEFRDETNIFRKFIQFSLKQGCFLRALPTWVNGRGGLPSPSLQPPVSVPSVPWAQRININPEAIAIKDTGNLNNLMKLCNFYWCSTN